LYFGEIILGHVRKQSIEYKRGMQFGVQMLGFNADERTWASRDARLRSATRRGDG
jgi:hypothetical protein